MGSNPMCGLPKAVTGDESAGDIPMWGSSIMDDYRKVVLGGASIGLYWPWKQPQFWPEEQTKVPFENDTCVNFQFWKFWAVSNTVVPFLILKNGLKSVPNNGWGYWIVPPQGGDVSQIYLFREVLFKESVPQMPFCGVPLVCKKRNTKTTPPYIRTSTLEY